MEQNGNNGFNKVFGASIGVIAAISGIYAIIRPMQQSIDDIRREVGINAKVIDELNKGTSRGAATELAKQSEKFTEVETQFKWMKEVTKLELEGHQKRLDILQQHQREHEIDAAKINTAHEERLKTLETNGRVKTQKR